MYRLVLAVFVIFRPGLPAGGAVMLPTIADQGSGSTEEDSHLETFGVDSHTCIQCREVDRRHIALGDWTNLANKGDHRR